MNERDRDKSLRLPKRSSLFSLIGAVVGLMDRALDLKPDLKPEVTPRLWVRIPALAGSVHESVIILCIIVYVTNKAHLS